jgi:WhiB family redox-sensing transcriptional regulator
MLQAACAGYDTAMFFPESGHSGAEAIKVCRTCPVVTECFEYAIEHSLDHGVWGGVSAVQRQEARWARGRVMR